MYSLSCFCVLLLAIFDSKTVSPTIFEAYGTLTCSGHKTWCYHVQVFERDSFVDDRLARRGTVCFPLHTNHYNLSGTIDKDEMTATQYEFYTVIAHNCTDDQSLFRMERQPIFAQFNETFVPIEWSGDIYRQGQKTSSYV